MLHALLSRSLAKRLNQLARRSRCGYLAERRLLAVLLWKFYLMPHALNPNPRHFTLNQRPPPTMRTPSAVLLLELAVAGSSCFVAYASSHGQGDRGRMAAAMLVCELARWSMRWLRVSAVSALELQCFAGQPLDPGTINRQEVGA